MLMTSISNPSLMRVIDEITHHVYFGCDQSWYPTERQKASGCGPTVACSLFFYLGPPALNLHLGFLDSNKKDCLSLMQEIWQYVTPGENGIPSTIQFSESVLDYARAKGICVEYGVFEVPEKKGLRLDFSELVTFIKAALSKDLPLAFLNLCHGDEQQLESWHWVTVISMLSDDNEKTANISILDQGKVMTIDLSLWYDTTTLGGGFVYFATTPGIANESRND